MNEEKRRSLERAGFVFGDAEDFLELTTDERERVESAMRRHGPIPGLIALCVLGAVAGASWAAIIEILLRAR